jgi:hypothetical protein
VPRGALDLEALPVEGVDLALGVANGKIAPAGRPVDGEDLLWQLF